MRLFSCLALLLCTPAPSATDALCGGEKARARMVDVLYAEDEDFRGWACEGPCSKEEFLRQIEFHAETLREKPRALGCFVTPMAEKTQTAIGVFVVADATPALQFIFHGISVDVSNRIVRGYRVLESTERPKADTWLRRTYEWNGKRYVLHSTTRQRETQK